jgi:hypothetical protein
MRYLSVLFFSLFSSILFAGTIDPNTSDQKYIEYGSKYKCVLRLHGKNRNNQDFFASAVAIKKNKILTAAHVVKDITECSVMVDNKSYKITKILCHEKFEEDNFGYYDIAMGHIDDNLSLDFYPELYTNSDEIGKVCGISGFGITGNFLTGGVVSDGKRRAGSNVVDYIDRKLLICSPSRANKTNLEFLISPGDSGGGLFIDQKLAGINSCVIAIDKKTNSNYSDESGHTRISEYVDWILTHAESESEK